MLYLIITAQRKLYDYKLIAKPDKERPYNNYTSHSIYNISLRLVHVQFCFQYAEICSFEYPSMSQSVGRYLGNVGRIHQMSEETLINESLYNVYQLQNKSSCISSCRSLIAKHNAKTLTQK